jgi:adenosylcobinamide-phosphate synthase
MANGCRCLVTKSPDGGAAEYFGKIKEKPILGPVGTKWDKKKIHSLIKLCKMTGYTSALLFILSFCWL